MVELLLLLDVFEVLVLEDRTMFLMYDGYKQHLRQSACGAVEVLLRLSIEQQL